MERFKNEWNKLGLYFIPSENNYVSYFLKRSWGNYLFFPHPEIENFFPFIIGSGGLYKVFDCALTYPFYNKLLFDKFGAPTIGAARNYHEDFLIEQYPDEYFDVDLKLIEQTFHLKIKNQAFAFNDLEGTFSSESAHCLDRFLRL
jgi:hypothetical protein